MNEKVQKFTDYYEKALPMARELETKLNAFRDENREVFEKMSKALSEILESGDKTYREMENETSSLDKLLSEIETDESVSDEDFDVASNAWSKIISLMDFIDDICDYCEKTSTDIDDLGNDDYSYAVEDYVTE